MMNDFVSGNQDMNKAAKNIEGMLGQIASTRNSAPTHPAEQPMNIPPDVASQNNDDTHRFISNSNEMPDLTTGFTNPNIEDAMQKTPDMESTFMKPPDSSVIKPENFDTPAPAPVAKPQNLDTSVIPSESFENNNAPLYMNPQRESAKVEFENNERQLMEMEHENSMVEPGPREQEQTFHQEPPMQQPQQSFQEEERTPESRHQVMEKMNRFSTNGPPPPVDVYEGQIPDLNRIAHQETGQTRSPTSISLPEPHHSNYYHHQQHSERMNNNNNLVMEPFNAADDGYNNPQLNRNPGDTFRKIISSSKASMSNILDKMDPHEIAGQADPSLLKHGPLDTSLLEEGNTKNKVEDISTMYSKPIGNIFGDNVNNQPIGRPMPYGDSGMRFQASGQFERKFRTPHYVKKATKLRKTSGGVYTGKRRNKLAEMYEDSIFPEDNMDIASLEGDLQGKTLTNFGSPSRGW